MNRGTGRGDAAKMVILDNRAMQLASPVGAAAAAAAAVAASSAGNQYLNPDYLAPLPTEVSESLIRFLRTRNITSWVQSTKCEETGQHVMNLHFPAGLQIQPAGDAGQDVQPNRRGYGPCPPGGQRQ